MAYNHGVYISEAATSIQPAVSTPSCLPVLFCTHQGFSTRVDVGQITTSAKVVNDTNGAPIPYDKRADYILQTNGQQTAVENVVFGESGGNLTVKATTGSVSTQGETRVLKTIKPGMYKIRNLKEATALFGSVRSVQGVGDTGLTEEYWAPAWAQQWFANAGAGDAFFRVLGSDEFNAELIEHELSTSFARFGVTPNVVCIGNRHNDDNSTSVLNNDESVSLLALSSIVAKHKAVAVLALETDGGEAVTPPVKDTNIIFSSPVDLHDGAGLVPSDAVLCGAMARVDAQNGGLPFASPSNNEARITGVMEPDGDTDDGAPLFLTQETANDAFNSKGVVTFISNAKGWVVWGDNTSAYPNTTDVKDRFIPVRRMFYYIERDFEAFAIRRVDMPLQKRQLQGIVDSYNQRLAGLIGRSALNSARIELDDERNTTESFLNGEVHFRLLIAPPPPMESISAVVEYDVEGFTTSLS